MNNTNHKTMLSEHFALEEFTYSRIAVENALDNTPPAAAKTALNHLVTYLLEPLRKFYKSPVAILSGYRSDAVNRLAGAVVASQHRKGEAADCYIPEGPCRLLDILKKSGLLFDQAILYKQRNFLHLSLKEKGTNRMQVLFYILCLVFLLPSCQIRRGCTREEHAFCIDSLVASGKDSSLFNRKTFTIDSINWNITRVVFSPPDSTGRQYPAEIALLQGNKHHSITDTSSKTANSSVELTRYQTAVSSFSSENQYKQSSSVSIWIVAFVLLAGACLGFGNPSQT